MNQLLRTCSTVPLFLLCLVASAQQGRSLSIHLDNEPFARFVEQAESQCGCRFYYDPQELDSLRVSIQVDGAGIREALDQALRDTPFRYAGDSLGHIFITRSYPIATTLPGDFFRYRTGSRDSASGPFAEAGNSGKPARTANEENKLYEIGTRSNELKGGNATLAGYVRDIRTGEAIAGAAISVDQPPVGTVTDQFGYFSLTLPRGRHQLRISSIGMQETRRQIALYGDGKLSIEMHDYVPSLKAVVVVSDRVSGVRGVQMGVEKINIGTIKQIPVVFGEADVIRAVLTLPGVTTVGEASTGFNVRGGSTDQNLILFNDATIYNPSHLFGFFSSFNPDVISDIELYKSSIPEKYGGRISSVLDVTTRSGNKKKFSGVGGIGPLTSKLTLEGPLGSDKTTFILGARTTYSDWILKNIKNQAYRHSSAGFSDLDLHLTHEFNGKNTLYFTAYASNDRFRLNSDTSYRYVNRNTNLKWKHIFNNKLYGVLLGGYDYYRYRVASENNGLNAYQLSFDISQVNLRADFTYTPSPRHNLDFGIQSTLYKLHPGSYQPNGPQSLVSPDVVRAEQGLENALYLGDRFDLSQRFSVTGGLRYSLFGYLGPQAVNRYAPGLPRTEFNVVDTAYYGSGHFIKTYQGPEIRLSGRYSLSGSSSVKLSFNTLRQYIHMLSNTTAISPTDIWKLSDPNIHPQAGQQVSLGYYQNFRSNSIETSVEVYYKTLQHYLDYKSGAQLVLNHHIETDVINTSGYAYGVELMVKKKSGKLNGWVSYAYSRTLVKQDDPIAGELINGGKYYPANFDKPHVANLVGNYRFSHRFSISLDMTYSTGRPITLPIAVYYLAGSQRLYYSDRNQFRIPDYFRTDFSMNIDGNHKVKKLTHNAWSLGVYNITGRRNPYSVYFVEENGVVHGYKLSIFGSAIPFITYNFRF